MSAPLKNADLTALNSFGFASRAQYLFDAASDSELLEAVAFACEQELPFLVIGGGSNLVLDEYIPGVVVRQTSSGYRLLEEDEQSVLLEVAAGQNWHQLVEQTVHAGWSGLENMALIPGTVGAAPVQNIGAYGVELKDRFVSLTAYDREERVFVEFSASQCCFEYRNSIFKSGAPGRYIITRVRLRLSKLFAPRTGYGVLSHYLDGQDVTAQRVFDAVVAIRQSKLPDPQDLGNAGSFFENPVVPVEQCERLRAEYPDLVAYPERDGFMKLAAGWLIDQAGWKGYRAGHVGVYEKQALVLVNYGQGSARELMMLAAKIQASVMEKYGVALVPEPRCYPQ
ncbi:UDP-N-acetylmuramate dehydrogenase [Pontibacterium granulatum]|uniref:UDP-N-acetylmuramate dehydrogenase n=1 Tax=Pontibacterium granulatum TaxID=2036029 RepID=UPI00249CF428|nr:UDP-N-acetylmuramate dehydrogenase [Pontibacterium granulatum]MDI3326098.1 UDP-N-acetylmuramate dehydrogenase [Pontibacterium granulatum]